MDGMNLIDLNRDVFLKITQYLNAASLRNYIGISEETYNWTNHIHYTLYRLKFDELPIRRYIEDYNNRFIKGRTIQLDDFLHKIILKKKILDNIFEVKLRYGDRECLLFNIIDSEDHTSFVGFAIFTDGEDMVCPSNQECLSKGWFSSQREGRKIRISKDDVITIVLNMLPDQESVYYYINDIPSRNIINKITHSHKQIAFSPKIPVTILSLRELRVPPVLPQMRYIYWNSDETNFNNKVN